jgi:hypothetical protein
VLFSSENVATFINNSFEPVWESVRPVPIVTIDFGNGEKITRTLHGNIATYLCNAQGTVFDILPGIYEPKEYQNQLSQFSLLFRYAHQKFTRKGPGGSPEELRAALAIHADSRLKAYHEQQAARLAAKQPADLFTYKIPPNGGRGKAEIEMAIELIAAGDAAKLAQPPGSAPPAAALPPSVVRAISGGVGKGSIEIPVERLFADVQGPNGSVGPPPIGTQPVPNKAEEIAGWSELVEDTRINESMRRRAIHEKLASAGRVKPEEIKKWLFKDVLAADLDDPTLGIGKLLDKRYPFADEDAAARRRGK